MKQIKQRVFTIIEIGEKGDTVSNLFDYFIMLVVFVNLAASFYSTFDESAPYTNVIVTIEYVTAIIFSIEYVLRFWTADLLFPRSGRVKSRIKFIFSFYGIVDLLSFAPVFIPGVSIGGGLMAVRLLRTLRMLKLFRINSQLDAFGVITGVLKEKRDQILSSISLIVILMLAASMGIYSLEHDAQPEQYSNAFSGLWWAVSTLLTVGYGDIYPITPLGKAFGILITFLGVGMVAIPTGIISAGFVEQYSRLQRISDYAKEENLHFVKIELSREDEWNGKQIADLKLPHGIIVAVIQRGKEIIVPRGDVILKTGDKLVLGAEALKGDHPVNLKEITLLRNHEWNDTAIKDLDISRQTYIVMVRRDGKALVPNGGLILRKGDVIILYTKEHLANEEVLTV